MLRYFSGGPCDNLFCDFFLEDSLYSSLRNARDNGVIVVVSSGNDTLRNTGHIISADGMVPCKADETICVGATVPDSNGVSNYANAGSRVDIWAPACIPTTPNGASPESLPVVCGTSFSSPFVAGIVAVMKAYEPDLGLEDVRNLLRSTAWTDSPDAVVTHSINAYAALRAVAEEKGADPFVKISGSALDGGSNEVPLNRTFTLTAQVYDNIFAYMDGEPSCPPAICPVTWSPTPESIRVFHCSSGKLAFPRCLPYPERCSITLFRCLWTNQPYTSISSR
ncbi:MAG: S8/S53 family peptidase, partial [Saccharospirillum sp.]|nr:S8/S53 family peptidase [Saccharospirillum sp.]